MGVIRRNRANMQDVENASSYRNRLIHSMEAILSDIERGPIFGHRMLGGTNGYNIFNVIDGLKTALAEYKSLEQQQAQNRHNNYQESREKFFDKPRKRSYLDYENDLMAFCEHEEKMCLYEEGEAFLDELERQLVLLTNSYYLPLAQIIANLLDTFRENLTTLQEYKMNDKSFVKPLTTIEEIKETLNYEIKKVDAKTTFAILIRKLTEPENVKKWGKEDSLAKMVNEVFVNDVFKDFAGRTITSFLEDKYQMTGEDLVRRIEIDWIDKLYKGANPLFYLDSGVYSVSQIEGTRHISVPEESEPIYKAAQNGANAPVAKSSMKDRILYISMCEVFPMAAYANLSEYENLYHQSYNAGRHLYEGSKLDSKGLDWRQLPSVTPLSKIPFASGNVSATVKENVGRVESIYQGMIKRNLLLETADTSVIRFVKPNYMERLRQLEQDVKAFKESGEKSPSVIQERQKEFDTSLKALDDEFKTEAYLEVTDPEVSLFWEGYVKEEEPKRRIVKDNFFSSPSIQQKVQKTLDTIAEIEKKLPLIRADIDSLAGNTEEIMKAYKTEYFNAVFTGVLSVEGMRIWYDKKEYGQVIDTYELSKMGGDFPYAKVPVYQAYISYAKLSEEIRTEIKSQAEAKLNQWNVAELKEAIEKANALLSDERVGAMIQQAGSMDKADVIKRFVAEMKKEFDNHKAFVG